MTDSADEIVLGVVDAWDPNGDNLEGLIAAALRSYGVACRNEGLEEAALRIQDFEPDMAEHIRSLKSSPSPIEKEPR